MELDRDKEQSSKEMVKTTRCSDALVMALEELGVRHAFGVPGGAIGSIFNSLGRSPKITTTLCQHEGGAAYMAFGRSLCLKSQNEIGLCFSTSGPGITNLITGVAAAFEERVPIFVLTGNVSTTLMGKGAAQDAFSTGIDAVKMLEPITWKSVSVMKPDQVVPMARELYKAAIQYRRPVHLNVPIDIASFEIREDSINEIGLFPSPSENSKVIDLDLIRRAAQSFLKEERPLLYFGNGVKVSGYESVARGLAEALGLPVLVTSHAKGVFPEDHPCYFGTFGFGANNRSKLFLESYQPTAIAYIGTRLGETATLGWSPLVTKPALKIHVDHDPQQLNKVVKVDYPLECDIMDFINVLFEEHAQTKVPPTWPLATGEARRQIFLNDDFVMDQSGSIHPRSLMKLLDFWLPDHAIIFCDIGNTMAWALHDLQIRAGQELYVPIGLGAMGSGICGAIGAKSAMPHRPVVCLTGDGAALMHGVEIFTAMNAGIGIKLIVLNDGGHGMVEHGQKLVGYSGDVSVRFKRPVNFTQFSGSLGVGALSATTLSEFAALPLQEFFSSQEPMVLDLTVDPRPVPPMASRTRVLGMTDKGGAT